MRRVLRESVALLAALALGAVAACSGGDAGADVAGEAGSVVAERAAPRDAAATPPAAAQVTPSPPPADPPPADPPVSPDALAGVLSREVAPVGSGGTVVVPGSVPAPGPGQERRVRVEVEGGLAIDGPAAAAFVLATLNDPRSWAADGLSFSRTDGDADVVVVLASPQTSQRMCRPLQTNGTLSCRQGPRAVITSYRWVNGIEDYGGDLTGYRQYVVNHEVGHVLGHGHEPCPGPGSLAPVMQQQTKDVDPCVPNPWPHPGQGS